MKKVPLSKGIYILPSLCTTASMFFAFFSIVRSINGDHHTAAWAIFFASFFDWIDGRLARMTKTQSDFGKEYDSLVDLASFGLAPSILIYTWTLKSFPPYGWFFAFLFFACAALRLARFNVQTNIVEKKRFVGLPSPPAACLVASFVLFHQDLFGRGDVRSLPAMVIVPLLGLLMVSRIGYRSFKEYDVQRGNFLLVLLMASIFIGLIALRPDVVIFLALALYVVLGPLGEVIRFFQKNGKKIPVKIRVKSRKLSVIGLSRDIEESETRRADDRPN